MADANSDRRLSRAQHKDAYDVAASVGVDVATFQVSELLGKNECLVTEFRHPPTRSFFRFDWFTWSGYDHFMLEWWPSDDGGKPKAEAHDWRTALASFRKWVMSVRLESETPDVWAIAKQERAWVASTESTFNGNVPFTDIEKEIIGRHLRTIEEHAIKKFALQEPDAAFVREELRYLREAADRMGRVDWKNIAFSVVVNLATGLALEPQKAQAFV
jgi:hypothetical protein